MFFDRYVIIDVYSRYVVGLDTSPGEDFLHLAGELMRGHARHGGAPEKVILHADRGSSMTSKPVAELLVDLGIIRSHSGPGGRNDNPFSEVPVQDP